MRRLIGLVVLASWPSAAQAQQWVSGRTTPSLREIVLLDATGEAGWPFGAEDVAGDGLDTFHQQEANVDIRSMYAVADSQQTWLRLYVADSGAAGSSIVAFVFMDLDANAGTGGDAGDPALHSRFVDDPSEGGYELVVGLRGNSEVIGAWTWDGSAFAAEPNPGRFITPSTGIDRDPLLLGVDEHGYLQATVAHELTGLDASCAAVLFARTWNDVPSQDYGDLDVGTRSSCVPLDQDGSGASDVVEGYGCDQDADCAGDGTCVDGACLAGNPCDGGADCLPDETCEGGRCLPTGPACTTNAECGDLVCDGQQCVPCGPAGSACDADRICAPTGRCIPDDGGGGGGDADGGFDLDAGEVQGGACTCRSVGGGTAAPLLALLLPALALWHRRRP